MTHDHQPSHPTLHLFLHLQSYVVPVVEAGQVYPSLGVYVLPLPDDHAGGGPHQTDGGCEGEGVHEPQLNRQVVRAAWIDKIHI